MSTLTMNDIPRQRRSDEERDNFLRNAIVGSLIFHIIFLLLKFPGLMNEQKAPKPAKSVAIKMEFIAPPKAYQLKKEQIVKSMSQAVVPVSTSAPEVAKTVQAGGATHTDNGPSQLSKKGSAKNGPLSTPGAGVNTIGDSSTKGYQFKGGKGLKALMGSGGLQVPTGGNSEGSRFARGGAGSGVGNNGTNLTGEYRAPGSNGDGSGFDLGKDQVGNYDRSTGPKGLGNKKGIDTAYVQPETVVLGAIDPEQLRKILQEYIPQFRYCYQQELQENSEKIKGIIDLNFRIEGSGRVSMVKIKSAQTQFSTKGIECMGGVLKAIDFPKPKGGGLVDVRQPLNFFAENTKI